MIFSNPSSALNENVFSCHKIPHVILLSSIMSTPQIYTQRLK